MLKDTLEEERVHYNCSYIPLRRADCYCGFSFPERAANLGVDGYFRVGAIIPLALLPQVLDQEIFLHL